jgi:HK97 gp10 family phage protein
VTANQPADADKSIFQMKKIENAIKMDETVFLLAEEIRDEAMANWQLNSDPDAEEGDVITKHINANASEVIVPIQEANAMFIEFGTYKMDAQPFLRPAVDKLCKQFHFSGYLQLSVNKAVS